MVKSWNIGKEDTTITKAPTPINGGRDLEFLIFWIVVKFVYLIFLLKNDFGSFVSNLEDKDTLTQVKLHTGINTCNFLSLH